MAPIVVEFLASESSSSGSSGEVQHSALAISIHGGGAAHVAPPESGTGTGEPGRHDGGGFGLMKMRGPKLSIGQGFLDRFLRDTKPLETIAQSGRVESSGRGTAVIHDRVTTVRIDRDGTAHFHNKPDVDIHWDIHLPTPEGIKQSAREFGREIAAWYADPYKLSRVGAMQDLPRYLTAVPGACERWGDPCSIEVRQRDDDRADRQGSIAHGKAEATDWLMRKFVGDPYASRKLKLLDDTRAERAELGAQHAREDLDRSSELMRKNLTALWAATSDPQARRDALFALWDECSEGESAAGAAGERARTAVIGWIRAKLPAGSPDAFTEAERARLDARRSSKQRFVPYQ